MERLDTGIGLSWEQILIAGVCLAVLLGVCLAAIRSARRGRRPTRMRTLALEPMSQRVERAADRARARPDLLTPARAAGSERRLEPSLSRSAAEERRRPAAPPPPPSRAEAEERRRPAAPPPPPLSRSMEEPRHPPAPPPAPRGTEDDLAALARANADQARTIKALKSQLDEVRQTARMATRRLDALEAALERMRADEAAARPGAQRRAPPPRPTAEPAPRESGDDDASPESRQRPGIALRGERRGR